MNDETVRRVADFCAEKFVDKKDFVLPDEYNYGHLPLCVIDAVFSIGVRYESVKNVVRRFSVYYNVDQFSRKIELTTTEGLELFEKLSMNELAEKILQNRQRTSAKNGILKAEAVILFLKVLQKYGVERFDDIARIVVSEKFESEIKMIPGQKSGIALRYFFMLAGSDDLIKPDRMILRFIEAIAGEKVSLSSCQALLTAVTGRLKDKGFNISPRKLDNLIWSYQRAS